MNDSEWRLARLLGEVVDIEKPEGTQPLRFLMADRGEGYLTALTAEALAQEAAEEGAASLVPSIERALFGTEDGGMLGDEEDTIPVGEFRRLLRDVWARGERAT